MAIDIGDVEIFWIGGDCGDGGIVLSVSPSRTISPLSQQKILADYGWIIFEYEIKSVGHWFYSQNKWV